MPIHLSKVSFGWPLTSVRSTTALPAVGAQGAPPSTDLLSDVNLVFERGWTAVIGANGAGKTALLRLIAGELRPTAGQVRGPVPVHLCPQSVEALEPAVEDFALDWGPTACRWRGRLELDPEALARWPTLSPGERKRWQVGAALAAEPPALLLDEPTNHLDHEGLIRLSEALLLYDGVGVIVSHDRAFLDRLARRTVWVAACRARPVPLPPSATLALLEQEAEGAAEALEQAATAASRARRRLVEARDAVAQAEASQSSAHRIKGPRDHDARSASAKACAANRERQRSRKTGLARSEVARAEARLADMPRPAELGGPVSLRASPAPRSTLLHLPRGPLSAGPRLLFEDVELHLDRGAHVHLEGPNGSGKSTLIRALLAGSTLPPERLLVLPQELSPAEERAWVERLRALPNEARGRVLQRVAALGVAPTRLLETARPSPGEARKLALAFGIATDVWAVVLDEPTNHLDLPSITQLEHALSAYPGALLLVSHDARLAAACCSARWSIRGGRVEHGASAREGQEILRRRD